MQDVEGWKMLKSQGYYLELFKQSLDTYVKTGEIIKHQDGFDVSTL